MSDGSGKRRAALYGGVGVLLAGLVYGGFVYKADPDPNIYVDAAAEQARHGLFESALADVERALALDPDHAYAHVVGAKACEGLRRWDRALEHYRRAGELYPDAERRRDIRISALRTLLLAERHEELETEAADILAEGSDATTHFILGASCEDRELNEKALRSYERAADGGGLPEAHFAAASVLARANRMEEARGHLEAGLAGNGENVAAWIALARLRLTGGDRSGAVAALRSACLVDPILVREELRRNQVWNPLKQTEEVADLFDPAPARAPE